MRYAMTLLNRVIDVIESEDLPSWPPDSQGNPVIVLECGEEVVRGMMYDEASKIFFDYIPSADEPTQLDRIEERLNLSYTEAQEQAVDDYTKELLEGGII